MEPTPHTDEYYIQAYREALANHEEYILGVLKLGVWDVVLTELNPSALTKDEWQELKQIEDRTDRAKGILVLIRNKDTLSSYIGFSRALCDCTRFLKKSDVFPFVSELEQQGRHPPVRRVGGQPTNQPIPVTNEANILWVIQSREDFKKVLSNYLSTQADHDNGVKKIGGFDFKSITIPITLFPEASEHLDVTLNLATPSTPKPDYLSFFSVLHPSPRLVILTCTGSPLGAASPGDVVVVRRGKLPTSVCAEVEHVTTLWRLNGEDSEGENVENTVRFGGGTRKPTHESSDVLVSSEEVVAFYHAADTKLKGVATLAVALLSKSDRPTGTGHLDFCYKLVHYFLRKFL